MRSFTYKEIDDAALSKLDSEFRVEHGDNEFGIIADEEFDRLFDHLAEVLRRYGTFSEDTVDGVDFSGYRYVDQVPCITTLVDEDIKPATVIEAALEAVTTSHRPLAASFELEDDYILVIAPDKVYGTTALEELCKG